MFTELIGTMNFPTSRVPPQKDYSSWMTDTLKSAAKLRLLKKSTLWHLKYLKKGKRPGLTLVLILETF